MSRKYWQKWGWNWSLPSATGRAFSAQNYNPAIRNRVIGAIITAIIPCGAIIFRAT
jgi:hypothetical protein